MHLDPSAVPCVCHTPANIPLHWQDKVKADLECDVILEVIERVPYREHVTWCHRMVVTRKHSVAAQQSLQTRDICNGVTVSSRL